MNNQLIESLINPVDFENYPKFNIVIYGITENGIEEKITENHIDNLNFKKKEDKLTDLKGIYDIYGIELDISKLRSKKRENTHKLNNLKKKEDKLTDLDLKGIYDINGIELDISKLRSKKRKNTHKLNNLKKKDDKLLDLEGVYDVNGMKVDFSKIRLERQKNTYTGYDLIKIINHMTDNSPDVYLRGRSKKQLIDLTIKLVHKWKEESNQKECTNHHKSFYDDLVSNDKLELVTFYPGYIDMIYHPSVEFEKIPDTFESFIKECKTYKNESDISLYFIYFRLCHCCASMLNEIKNEDFYDEIYDENGESYDEEACDKIIESYPWYCNFFTSEDKFLSELGCLDCGGHYSKLKLFCDEKEYECE